MWRRIVRARVSAEASGNAVMSVCGAVHEPIAESISHEPEVQMAASSCGSVTAREAVERVLVSCADTQSTCRVDRLVVRPSGRSPDRHPVMPEHALRDDQPLAWRRHRYRSSAARPAALFAALRHADRGAATAEFAVVLPAVVAVAVLLLCLSRAVIVSMDCQDAAAAAARELVISGEEAVDAAAMARAVAGDGVTASVTYGGDRVTVVTQCPVVPDPLGVLPTRVTGTASGVVP